jgi:dTDP-4-dehydrorhamnose reductase
VKLLVTGGAGYLGSEVCRQALERGWEVLATGLSTPPPHGPAVRLDVRDEDATERVLIRHGPTVVIHTAYRLRGSEMRETIVRGSHAVAQAAHRCGARLVHVSTDLVFDGEQGAPYGEDAEPRPMSDYGAAKLEAERLVARAHDDAVLVRTSLLYGKATPGPQEVLALRDDVAFYTDEIRCPTLVGELAAALLELAQLDVSGPLHVAGADAVSRHEFACLLRGAPVPGAPSPRDGRPRNVALDSTKAAALLTTRLTGVRAAIGRSS